MIQRTRELASEPKKMNVPTARLLLAVACLVGLSEVASAQTLSLPAASRTVYKCTVNNKIVYTDEPCMGAQVVDVEPTRGMNKSTGRELTGADVQAEKFREQLADGIKPITGLSPQQFDVKRRRINLPGDVQAECSKLDGSIAQSEADERGASGDAKTDIQRSLFVMRKRSRELRC
jgi:hypothetical protein